MFFFPVGYHFNRRKISVFFPVGCHSNRRKTSGFFPFNSSALVQHPFPFYIVTFCRAPLRSPQPRRGTTIAHPASCGGCGAPFIARHVEGSVPRSADYIILIGVCIVYLHYYRILWPTLSNSVLKLTTSLAVYSLIVYFVSSIPTQRCDMSDLQPS